MFLTAVTALEMWHERNKEWERDMFLKGPSMARLPSSPLCFPADSGRIAQHAAHRAISLASCTATPAGQGTAFSWFVAKQSGDRGTMGYGVGSLQQEDDKCSPWVKTLIPVACPHDLSASILQKVRNTWIIYLLWLHWNCNKTVSYKIRTNPSLFTFSIFQYRTISNQRLPVRFLNYTNKHHKHQILKFIF